MGVEYRVNRLGEIAACNCFLSFLLNSGLASRGEIGNMLRYIVKVSVLRVVYMQTCIPINSIELIDLNRFFFSVKLIELIQFLFQVSGLVIESICFHKVGD